MAAVLYSADTSTVFLDFESLSPWTKEQPGVLTIYMKNPEILVENKKIMEIMKLWAIG